MELSECRSRLLELPVFADMPGPLRDRAAMCLLWVGRPARYAAGDVIYVQGAEDENTGCVLLEGAVDVLRDHAGPVRVPAPELLGEMQQLEPTAQRTATVQVVEDVEALVFSWHDFVGVSGILLNSDEQVALRDAVRAAAARRQG